MTLNYKKKHKVGILGTGISIVLATLVVGLLSILTAPAAYAGDCPGGGASCTPSASILNYRKAQIVNDESQCTTDLADQNTNHGGDPVRTRVDNSNPYKQVAWITGFNAPDQPINATVNQVSVNLQLNTMQFNCAVLVHDNETNGNGGSAAAAPNTKVTNAQWPNDRQVYGDGDSFNHSASRYELRTRIVDASIVSVKDSSGAAVAKGSFGSPSTIDKGQVLLASRGGGGGGSAPSRYWLSNNTENFTYFPAGGKFTKPLDITLNFKVDYWNTYHDVLGGGGDINTCDGGSDGPDSSVGSISVSDWNTYCSEQNVRVTFHVGIPPTLNSLTINASCSAVRGFAQDGDFPASPVTVKAFNSSGTLIASGTTGAGHIFNMGFSAAFRALIQTTNQNFTVTAYGIGAGGNTTVNQNVGPCGPSCGSTTMPAGVVTGSTVDFQVSVNDPSGFVPPPSDKFNITITGPGLPVGGQVYSNIDALALAAGKIFSSTTEPGGTVVSFTPPAVGTYTMIWSYSTATNCPFTIKVGFGPYFSVLGGDISAGNGVTTTGGVCTGSATADIKGLNDPTTYNGGGSQVGALATRSIKNFASGLGLSGGPAALNGYGGSFANFIGASFVLGGASGNYGGTFGTATSLPCVHDYQADRVAGMTDLGAGVLSFGGLSGSHTMTPSPFTVLLGTGIPGDDLQLGDDQDLTLYVKGCVYIRSNIVYGYSSVKHIPHFKLIVQGNIYVNHDVTKLEGTYVAQKLVGSCAGSTNTSGTGGFIATCSTASGTDTQDYGVCGNPLTFTGSVAAESNIVLDRSRGSVLASGGVPVVPAEIFRYSPELWLNNPPNVTLDYQSFTNLPPVL